MTTQNEQAVRLGLEEMLASVLLKLKAPTEDRCAVRAVFRAYVNDGGNYPWSMDRFMFTVGQTVGNQRWYQKLDGDAREKFIASLRELVEALRPSARDIIEELYADVDDQTECPEEEALIFWDGYDEAIIGVGERFQDNGHRRRFLIYDRTKVIELIGRSCREEDDGSPLTGEEWEQAEEFFEFNVAGGYVGTCTPAHVTRVSDMPY